MQPVQTCKRFGAPLTMARTRWMFGFQRRLVRRCECDTVMPHDGCFPQTSQTAAIEIRGYQRGAFLPNDLLKVMRRNGRNARDASRSRRREGGGGRSLATQDARR